MGLKQARGCLKRPDIGQDVLTRPELAKGKVGLANMTIRGLVIPTALSWTLHCCRRQQHKSIQNSGWKPLATPYLI